MKSEAGDPVIKYYITSFKCTMRNTFPRSRQSIYRFLVKYIIYIYFQKDLHAVTEEFSYLDSVLRNLETAREDTLLIQRISNCHVISRWSSALFKLRNISQTPENIEIWLVIAVSGESTYLTGKCSGKSAFIYARQIGIDTDSFTDVTADADRNYRWSTWLHGSIEYHVNKPQFSGMIIWMWILSCVSTAVGQCLMWSLTTTKRVNDGLYTKLLYNYK